jgi:hypothetical protein
VLLLDVASLRTRAQQLLRERPSLAGLVAGSGRGAALAPRELAACVRRLRATARQQPQEQALAAEEGEQEQGEEGFAFHQLMNSLFSAGAAEEAQPGRQVPDVSSQRQQLQRKEKQGFWDGSEQEEGEAEADAEQEQEQEEEEEEGTKADAAHALLLHQPVLPHQPFLLPSLGATAVLLDGSDRQAVQQMMATLQVCTSSPAACAPSRLPTTWTSPSPAALG